MSPDLCCPAALAVALADLTAAGAAFLATLACLPLCRMWALRRGLVDLPGGRKRHAIPVPLSGGLAVFLAFIVILIAWLSVIDCGSGAAGGARFDAGRQEVWFLVAAGSLVFATGLADDILKPRGGLSAGAKLTGQILAALLAAPALIGLDFLDPAGDGGALILVPILLLWLLAVTNAFNFSDNINGLMGGLAVIGCVVALCALPGPSRFLRLTGSILAGGVLAFLPFNYPRARVFGGDAGSHFIGFWLALITWPPALTPQDIGSVSGGVVLFIPAVLILAVPLGDALFVVSMRLKARKAVYLGDDRHLSHRLVRGGFSAAAAVLLLWGVAILCAGLGAVAAAMEGWGRYALLGVGCGIIGLLCIITVRTEKKRVSKAAST